MMSQPPAGQGPIDPQGAFSPPPSPGGGPGRGAPLPPPPPGFYPPPPMMMPPWMMKPPRERSFARAIFTTLATTIFGLSIILNVYLLLVSGLTSSRQAQQEKIIEKGDDAHRIAVINIDGIILDRTYDTFHKEMKAVRDDSTIDALVVQIDSPGGSVTPSDEIYHDLLNYKAERGKPVVISQGGLAASGAYYISCAGDYIVAQPTTLTGNIGVLMERFNLSQMLDKLGIKDATLKASGSPYKNDESWFQPETPEARAYLQGIIDDAYGKFRDVVADGRKNKLKGNIADIANGKIYTSDQALKLGLVDQVDYPAVAYSIAASRAGISKPTVVRIEETPSLLKALGMEDKASVGNVKIDADSLLSQITPHLMYLWDGH